MTLDEHLRREADATRRFMDKHTMDDFLHGSGVYSLEYRCACGFRCRAPRAIYEHAQGCTVPTEQQPEET